MSTNQPPKLALKLFRLYCSDERQEELEGDLHEVYLEYVSEKGTRYAAFFYWWLVIKGFRSYALKRTKMDKKKQFISVSSLTHNIKIAWRNILRRRTTTAINVIGLAIGVGGFIAIYSLVAYERSFNRHIPEAGQIYRIYTEFGGAFSGINPGAAPAVPGYLREHASIIDELVHFHNFNAKVKVGTDGGDIKSFDWNSDIILADSTYFSVINQYEWLAGSPEKSLSEPKQVVLAHTQAEKYFGEIPPLDMIGKTLTYQDSLDVQVSGIVSLKSKKSDFLFTDFISFKTIDASWLKDSFNSEDWSSVNSSWQTIVKVVSSAKPDQVEEMMTQLNDEVAKHEADRNTWKTTYKKQPLDELHYGTSIGIFDNTGPATNLETLNILLVVALALLTIAIFNFINLETAQAINKSKEVGLRKAMGISRVALIGRFLTESTMVTFLAALVSLPLAYYGVRLFDKVVPKGFSVEWSNPVFWLSVLALIFVVGVLSGIYPAIVTSSFSPIQALKSTLNFSAKAGKGQVLRKVLIASQFIFSQLLVICTFAVLWQNAFLLNKEMGFNKDGVIYFNTPYYERMSKQEILIHEIKSIPNIAALSFHESPPARNGWSTSTMKYYDQDSTESVQSVHQKMGDENYLDVYQLDLVAGRNIRERAEKKETLINETYVEILGFESPEEALGIQLSNGDRMYEVVGVLKDFHFAALRVQIEPLMYSYNNERTRCIGLSVSTGELETLISTLSDKWERIYPDEPLEVKFLDETVESFYRSEQRTSRVASVATVVAILISCLGLFGLISYSILQKSKELGIRKVLGASLMNIGGILSREFFLLIVIGFIVSLPLAYLIIENWMERFAYQSPISWWIYALGIVVSLLMALLTVGSKIWKASKANPVDSLRYE